MTALTSTLPTYLDGIVRVDRVTVAMLGLIGLVGWSVVRFSRNYLAGDPRAQQHHHRLLATLAAVSVVIVANNVIVLAAAWAAASIALHGLLKFFDDRPAALAVAHKKFLLARCADACMVGAIVALSTTFDTFRLDVIAAEASGAASLPTGARIGILLVAVAAVLKCAQIPFHGWLIQVMEAPTPVSALLHAGVVNLGGFVLIRFAPVVDGAIETRTLLVVVGACTAVVASLVMTTRVSVKVSLAWSTCAQMGFMLVQCGLGLWEMALLHLLAHSVYKAHAFLGAGGTVRQTQLRRLAPEPPAARLRSVLSATAVSAGATVAVSAVWLSLPGTADLSAAVWLMVAVVALAVVPLTRRTWESRPLTIVARAVAVPFAYLLLHELAARLVAPGAPAPAGLLVVTGAAVAVVFVVQTTLAVAPEGRLSRSLRPWIYAGLFLDDVVTRAVFSVSPPSRPTARVPLLPVPDARVVLSARTPSSAVR